MPTDKQTRRTFLQTSMMATIGLSLPIGSKESTGLSAPSQEMFVYVGTYTTGKSEGIYLCKLNLATGALKLINTYNGLPNPSFLAADPQVRYLYAVNEITEFEGKPSGAISAFSVDAKTGNLTLLNQQPTMGGAPCHVAVDASGKWVLVANYVGGSIAVFPVQADGRLGAPTEVVQHKGSSVHPKRQEGPHAHNVVLDPTNQYVFASDLGLDKIMIYRLDAQGKLIPNEPAAMVAKPGAGPRHFTFHPGGRYAFGINELNATITAFSYDPSNGSLQERQTVSTLPKGFSEESYCADIHVSPNGKFLYGSNRGHNSVVVFTINQQTGKLTYLEHMSTQGKWPRSFSIDPTGTFLLVANQHTDTIVTYRIDKKTGRLNPVGQPFEVPAPVSLLLVPAS